MGEPAEELVEHFFRHESANLVAVLTRAFGWRRIDLIEDMVSSAILEAMRSWKQKGIPDNPSGWIHRVARNRVIDALRRELAHEKAIAFSGQTVADSERLVEEWLDVEQLPDSLLRMIFVCCHPSLDRTSQVALTLKILCGFSVAEIASGLLLSAENAKKKIQRAKRTLASMEVQLELPSTAELHRRLHAVHDVLYLMFNEGYSTSRSVEPIRDDLCEEAARLCHLLCMHESFSFPETRALLALMLFHAARLEARVNADGVAVLLEDQDRTLWDHGLVGVGKHWIARATEPLAEQLSAPQNGATSLLGDRRSRFHYEAAIAMHHCCASSVEETNWTAIILLYDRLLAIVDSPLYTLNRAIAMGQAGNTDDALQDIEAIRHLPNMRNYALLDCAEARLRELCGESQLAIAALERALEKQPAEHEAAHIRRQLKRLRGSGHDTSR